MPWRIFTGNDPKDGQERWRNLPGPPPWRQRATAIAKFVPTEDLVDAVNTALHLRRPLLLTGAPGSGKSTLVSLIAAELGLGDPLNWYITSRSVLQDGLYQYDALGRLHATQDETAGGMSVEDFVTLGPLGTALASEDKPRAVLIDEIDKSDFDLPGDLLNILEEGEFDIPPLVRDNRVNQTSREHDYLVRGSDQGIYIVPHGGVVRRTHWPIIIMTSNGERTFPAPFLRRCVRFEMSTPSQAFLETIIDGYVDSVTENDRATIIAFAQRLVAGERLAIDQLLNYLYLVTGQSDTDVRLDETVRARLESTLLEELSGK